MKKSAVTLCTIAVLPWHISTAQLDAENASPMNCYRRQTVAKSSGVSSRGSLRNSPRHQGAKMTLRFLTLLLLLGAAFGSEIHAQANSIESRGSELYHACQADIRFMDAPNANAVSNSDYVASEFCRGYFMAFNDFYNVEATTMCLDGASMGTTIRVYVAYMEKNPKLMDAWMITGVGQALRENYPCPDPKPALNP
jgi:Rap1a immunity proteins